MDKMSGIQFEEALAAHFKNQGYKVSLTPASNDYGADLILKSPRGEKICVQAKRYSGKVGNKAIQEIIGALGYYQADRGMVVTNSYYTNNAVTLANANNVELWDRNTLISHFELERVK